MRDWVVSWKPRGLAVRHLRSIPGESPRTESLDVKRENKTLRQPVIRVRMKEVNQDRKAP
jgi:hypothetical protein